MLQRRAAVHAFDGDARAGGGPGWAAAVAGALAREVPTTLVVPAAASVQLDPWVSPQAAQPEVRSMPTARTRGDDLRRALRDRRDLLTVVQSPHPPRLTASSRSAVLVDFPLSSPASRADRWRLDRYRLVLANSPFTARWVARRWGREAEVLPPLVPAVAPAAKEPLVLSIGRFTGGSRSKGQLEMVEAFRRLGPEVHRTWSLHLAGFVADPQHLAAVRAAASDLPVVLHPDAARDEVEALCGRATVYWHACGVGADATREPERFEHFGIAVVEAMSAGAAPLVLSEGGPAEVVAGVAPTWTELDQLVAETRALVESPTTAAGVGERARTRAERYGRDAFNARVDALLPRLRPR